MTRTIGLASLFVGSAVLMTSCVEHRPERNGLRNESVYLEKTDLLNAPDDRDDSWLYKVTVVGASSPNVLGDYVFPGLESELQLANFRFREDTLQVLDGRQLQADDPDNPDDDTVTRADRVLMEFDGTHVDVRFRETLDGERTNLIEENTELPWEQRQQFKVDFENTSMDPVTSIAWFYGDFVNECARQVGTSFVPDSYEWDQDEQHMSFVVEVNYALTVRGGCYDMVSLATGTGTATIQYRFSFWRPEASTYEAQIIDEKDEVNKRYGAFQVLSIYRDANSGLLDATSYLQRWNPNREEPATFYFHEGFPSQFKPMFDEIASQTNQVLEEAGASLRFEFKDHDWDGEVRHLGDIRHSFVVWHQDIDTTRGLLGYGPSAADPRSGEVYSANLHLYNVGMDYYRFLIEDYLTTAGAEGRENPEVPWEETACTAGETVVPADTTGRLQTGLFQEMRRVMDLPEPAEGEDPTDQFIPTPVRDPDLFLADYQRTLGELRYVRPEWNDYVYRTGHTPLGNFRERLATEREFNEAMHSVLMNENPFGPVTLTSRAGIDAQNDFAERFRGWSRNHEQLHADQEDILARRNVYVFNDLDAISAIAGGARQCKDDGFWESDVEFRDRIVEDVVAHVAIHELGHNLSLRHNFYGSVDHNHTHEGDLSSSVMDYVVAYEEAGTSRGWGQYDIAALKWIYGTEEVRDEMMREDFLFCTDQHRFRSPLCRAHDLGVTPAQITLNAIERYDWLYNIRNRRAYRTFWDTSSYVGQVYNGIFPLLRMWYLAIFDWGGGGVQDLLKRLDQVDPSRNVLTDPEYDEIAIDFYNDVSAATDLMMAFMDALINQPASSRNYQTEFDPFYGDVLRLGIIVDKLYATFAFMDLQDVYNYNPNVNTFVAMYDAPFGNRNYALSQRVLDNMLGANYDTFPWFRYFAVNLFASTTNTNLVNGLELRERIAIRRYENREEFELEYGADALAAATARDNPAQLFIHEGEEYAYTYLEDQGWHLVSNRSRSPVSFQFMKDYNEDLNAGRRGNLDNYGLKILLAYYEYYNNFVGF